MTHLVGGILAYKYNEQTGRRIHYAEDKKLSPDPLSASCSGIHASANSLYGIHASLSPKTGKKVLNLLGLAQKAGLCASGTFMVEKSLANGKAKVVLIASDASANTRQKFLSKSTYYGVPAYVAFDSDQIGHAIGKEFRVVLSVNQEGMAGAIKKEITQLTGLENDNKDKTEENNA
jgi:ribosomal protein L7Ae-like RNA K-turn-binding protein